MTFDASWLAVYGLDPEDRSRERWHFVGVLLRGGGVLSFHPIRGFETVGAGLVTSTETATAGGNVDDAWDYLLDRGVGGLSSFSEPDKMEADDRQTAVAELMRRIPPLGPSAPG